MVGYEAYIGREYLHCRARVLDKGWENTLSPVLQKANYWLTIPSM